MNPRLLALKILHQVLIQGKSLNQLSGQINNEIGIGEDRALCRQLVYGTVRWYEQLNFVASLLLKKPLKDKDSDVYILLLSGIYQLLHTRIPDHAAVNETVKLTVKIKKAWARALLNGVLRNFIRDKDKLDKQITGNPVAQYSHPQWLIDVVKNDWPEQWREILEANNQQGPMSIRANVLKNTREELQKLLADQSIESETLAFATNGLRLLKAKDPVSIVGFKEGLFSVQDEAAQLASELLDVKPGMAVLDACAAPGGKTAAILESCAGIKLQAIDVDDARLDKVRETLQRLNLSAQLMAVDAADVESWWQGQVFDRILLDAPCSGTGVIRRNPDIKIHRRLEDLARLVDNQRILLQKLWSILKPGGILLYATCSIVKDENENQIAEFIQSREDAEMVKIQAQWGRQSSFGRQILPGEHDMDGFFYASIRKLT